MLAWVSPPDRHGYFSLGTDAEYAAAMIGEVPFFVEVNAQMPRTFGANQLHISDIVGFCESSFDLVELPPAAPSSGIGGSPNWSPSGYPTARRSRSASARCRTWC